MGHPRPSLSSVRLYSHSVFMPISHAQTWTVSASTARWHDGVVGCSRSSHLSHELARFRGMAQDSGAESHVSQRRRDMGHPRPSGRLSERNIQSATPPYATCLLT